VADVAFTKLHVGVPERNPVTRGILRMPLLQGGFGLTSMTDTSPAAYIASLAAMAVNAGAPSPSHDLAAPLPSDSLLFSWIDSSIHTLRTQIADLQEAASDSSPCKALQKLPSSSEDFFSHFHSQSQNALHLQSHLNKQAAQLRFHAAIEDARKDGDMKLVAHYLSFSAPRASTWKSVIPSHKAHVLADSHYRVSARYNLGLAPHRTVLPDNCASCGIVNAIKRDPWHHLSCNSHKRQEITLRHDTIVNALFHHAHYSGAAAAKEPAGLSTEDGRRPDLHIVVPGLSILTDVVVSHPLAPSHLSTAASKPLATANQAALRKHSKYTHLADTQQAHFVPFSVETSGGMTEEAEELVDQLSLACKDHLTLPSSRPFANSIRSSIAVAIQKGNALAIHAGFSRAVMRAGGQARVA
jgi:hypothetical protein